jgi:hypothetical protein
MAVFLFLHTNIKSTFNLVHPRTVHYILTSIISKYQLTYIHNVGRGAVLLSALGEGAVSFML